MNQTLHVEHIDDGHVRLSFELEGRAVFGTGERFDAVRLLPAA